MELENRPIAVASNTQTDSEQQRPKPNDCPSDGVTISEKSCPVKNDENAFQLDHERAVALLKEKVLLLERSEFKIIITFLFKCIIRVMNYNHEMPIVIPM